MLGLISVFNRGLIGFLTLGLIKVNTLNLVTVWIKYGLYVWSVCVETMCLFYVWLFPLILINVQWVWSMSVCWAFYCPCFKFHQCVYSTLSLISIFTQSLISVIDMTDDDHWHWFTVSLISVSDYFICPVPKCISFHSDQCVSKFFFCWG